MPSKEQSKEIKSAAKRAVQFEHDCPELSPIMMKAFKCAVKQKCLNIAFDKFILNFIAHFRTS